MDQATQVHVRLGSSIASSYAQSRLTIQVGRGATIGEVAQELVHRYPDLQKALQTAIVIVNGEVVENDHMVAHDDQVSFLAPVAGG